MSKDRVNLRRDKRKTPITPRKDKTQKKSTKGPFDPSKFPDWKEEISIPPGTGYIVGGTAPLPASSADTAEISDVTSAGDSPQERMNRKRVDQLSQACRDPGFAAFVNNESDPGARRWAAFCLSLADVDRLSDDRRQSLYRGIRQERRAALLDRLAGAKVPRELAATLIRLSPTELGARAVRQLARDATTPTTLRALAPLDQLTPRLAAQLGLVPERFRTPGLLSILNRLELSRDFWGKLEANLASIPADLAGSIMGRLRRARSNGGFFDAANAVWEATQRDAPFRLGLGKVSDARLVILDRPSALAAQARRMQNCLADYKFLPRDGDVIYAVWRGSEPATVELVWAGRRWRLGDVRGRKMQWCRRLRGPKSKRRFISGVMPTGESRARARP